MKDIRKIMHDSGDIFLPVPVKKVLQTYIVGSKDSLFYISGWTVMHFISGIIMTLILMKKFNIKSPGELFIKLLIIHTLWEVWQIFIGMTNPLRLRDSIDITVDTISFLLGALLVYFFSKKK
jgi:hypothetical protein